MKLILTARIENPPDELTEQIFYKCSAMSWTDVFHERDRYKSALEDIKNHATGETPAALYAQEALALKATGL